MAAYINRGTAYRLMGQYNNALKNYQQAIQHNPDDIDSLYNAGSLLMEQEKYPRSITLF